MMARFCQKFAFRPSLGAYMTASKAPLLPQLAGKMTIAVEHFLNLTC